MPDWEIELRDLLRSLDVSLEPRATRQVPVELPVMFPSGGALADESDPSDSMVRALERSHEQTLEQGEPEGDEINAIRQEIKATVARVVHLTRTGQLDPALRDDVVFVLRALTRTHPATLEAQVRDEWDLASAAAVLHFCRVVLRLTGPLAPDV